MTDFLLLCMALIWGVNFIVVKFGTQVFEPIAFNTTRVAIAVVVLWLVVLVRRTPIPGRGDVRRMLALGVLGNGVYQILFVEGLARTRASDAALLVAASPLFIEVIGRMRGLERLSVRGRVGLLFSIAGIGLVVSGGGRAAGDSSLLGNALVLSASLCWAVYSVFLKPLTERVDGLALSAITMTGGLVPMAVVAAPALARTEWGAVSTLGWGALAYSGLLALVLAYLFWYRGVRVLGPTRAAMYGNVQPVFAMIAAWLLLNEVPRSAQLAGGAMILSGILLTRLPAVSTPVSGE